MRRPLRSIVAALNTIRIGMQITLRYCFARTVTLQYPDMPPAIQPRFRGFHWYEIEKCSACGLCAKACPVDCIYVQSSGPRKIDRASGMSRGGAMVRYAIDYSRCMFCGLCTEPCPTQCLHMGNIHDLSGYDRPGTVVEFTELAKQGLRTPLPIWMQKKSPPAWAQERKDAWVEQARPRRAEMNQALTNQTPAKKPPPEGAAAAPASPAKES
jgi:NADH-quinone oxidoreductase subunit I